MGAGVLGILGVNTVHVQRHVDLGKGTDIENDTVTTLSQDTEDHPVMGKRKRRIQTSVTHSIVHVRVGFYKNYPNMPVIAKL
jgi:hypothetical protein